MSQIYYRENSDDLLNSETIVVELASTIISPIFQGTPTRWVHQNFYRCIDTRRMM